MRASLQFAEQTRRVNNKAGTRIIAAAAAEVLDLKYESSLLVKMKTPREISKEAPKEASKEAPKQAEKQAEKQTSGISSGISSGIISQDKQRLRSGHLGTGSADSIGRGGSKGHHRTGTYRYNPNPNPNPNPTHRHNPNPNPNPTHRPLNFNSKI